MTFHFIIIAAPLSGCDCDDDESVRSYPPLQRSLIDRASQVTHTAICGTEVGGVTTTTRWCPRGCITNSQLSPPPTIALPCLTSPPALKTISFEKKGGGEGEQKRRGGVNQSMLRGESSRCTAHNSVMVLNDEVCVGGLIP